MSTPTQDGVCIIMWMSDVDKKALRKHGDKTGIELFIAPHTDMPDGATHAVYQHTPNGNRVIGHGKFYTPRKPR